MNKNYFIELSTYNVWANNEFRNWLLQLSQEQLKQPLVSSFNNIEATALHIVGAESVWLERLNQVQNWVWLPSVFKGTTDELLQLWEQSSEGLHQFVKDLPEEDFMTKVSFKNLKGDAFEMPYYKMLAHVFNHSTYHRGQLTTMLRQVDFTDVSSTDMINFYRML